MSWPNGMEGTRELGQDAVRAYWLRQWGLIDPRGEPFAFEERPDGAIAVEMHQVVRDLQGSMLNDRRVWHLYQFEGELVCRMDIEEA